MITKNKEDILKTFPELRNLQIRTNKVFVQLELTRPKNLLLPGMDEVGQGGMPTGRGWLLAVGKGCELLTEDDIGCPVYLSRDIDLQPMINVSQTSKENLRPNPGFRGFTFKNPTDEKDRKEASKKPTILVYEHELEGIVVTPN